MERPPPGMSKMQEMKWKKEQTKLSTRAVAASGPPAQPLGPPPGMTKMQQAKWKREQAKLAAAPAARKDSVSESSAATRIQARQRGRRDRRALQQRRRGGDGGGPPRSAGRAGQTAGRAGRSPQVEPEPEPTPTESSVEEGEPPTLTVEQWLASIKLQRYAEGVKDFGYDELEFLVVADEADIEAMVKATSMKLPHAKVFKLAWVALVEKSV